MVFDNWLKAYYKTIENESVMTPNELREGFNRKLPARDMAQVNDHLKKDAKPLKIAA